MVDGLSSQLGDIGSESILDAGISAADLANSSVSGAIIEDSSIAPGKLAANAVINSNISGLTIAAGKFADNAITTSVISGLAVTTAKIAADAISGNVIKDSSIAPGKLATDCVVTAAISGLSVTTAKIAASAVTGAKHAIIGAGSPTGYGMSIQTGSVIASNVAVWTSYGTAFTAAPYVVLGCLSSGALATQPGMATTTQAGSFSMLGESGLAYFWIAAGSGNI